MTWCKYGKKRKAKPVYNGVQYDSTEEVEFIMWLEEANRFGYVEDYAFHTEIYRLLEKSKVPCPKTLKKQGFLTLQDVEYELDFRFKPTLKLDEFEHGMLIHNDGYIYVDTKGDWKGNDTVFSIKQKLMYKEYEIYVNRVVPIKLFQKTWLPQRAGLTDVRKERKKSYKHLKIHKELGK